MKTSVLIIAHNEEKDIAKCIESLLDQTISADEVVLLAHNITDRTVEIAKKYPIKVVAYEGPRGITYARLRGLESLDTQNEVVLCIDGDSYAAKNWIEEMTSLLSKDGNDLVGSWVKPKGTLFGKYLAWKSKTIKKGTTARMRIWGPSFAFYMKDREAVTTLFKESIEISRMLQLSFAFDDYWLALCMEKTRKLAFTNKTYVVQHTKEKTSLGFYKRFQKNSKEVRIIDSYYKSLTEITS